MKSTHAVRAACLFGVSSLAFSAAALAQTAPATEEPAAATTAAPAQERDRDLKLKSVTVTAERREESANDVAMDIQAFDADTLEVLRVTDVADLSSVVPSFSVSQSYQGVPTYTLRGIGFNTINLSATSTVGTYVDEVAYPYPIMNSGPVFDMERVEVLKGPQGTLFGRNTTAGLLNFVTAKPSDEPSARLSVEAGNFETLNVEAMATGPLGDRAQGRVAMRKEVSNEGWQKSVSRDDERGQVDKLGIRAALSMQPTDKLDLDFSYNGWWNKSGTIGAQAIGLTPGTDPNFISPVTGAPPGASAFNAPGLVDFVNNQNWTDGSQADWAPANARSQDIGLGAGLPGELAEDSQFHGLKAQIAYTFDNDMRLVSLTGYNDLTREALTDYSGAPFEILLQDIEGEIQSFSQEIRLEGSNGNFDWLVGAYYGKDDIFDSNRTMLGQNANVGLVRASTLGLIDSPLNVDPETGEPYSVEDILSAFRTYRDTGEFEATTGSIFANLDWEISPQFSLSTGVRYTEDSQDYIGCSRDVNGSMQPNVNVFNRTFFTAFYGQSAPPAPLEENQCNTYSETTNSFGPVTSDLTEDNVSWRVTGNWTPTDTILAYASVSRGYKSASTPVNAASKAEQNAPATQEELTSYEIGIKAGLFNDRVQANAAAFFYDYKDKQVSAFFPDPIYNALSRLQNAPEAEAYGLDAELTALLTADLTAVAGLTLLHTEFGDFPGVDSFGLPTNRKGDPFLYSPETTASLSLIYDNPLNGNIGVRGALNGRWQSESTAGIPSEDLYDIDSYGLLNGSLGIYKVDGPWEVSIWGRNLTDEYYWQQVTANANTTVRFAGKPRTYGATLTFKF